MQVTIPNEQVSESPKHIKVVMPVRACTLFLAGRRSSVGLLNLHAVNPGCPYSQGELNPHSDAENVEVFH